MIDFSQRSYKKELLDQDNIPFADIRLNMMELNTINTWLGGHRITLNGIKKIAGNAKKITVCEIGCGGGDNLLVIYKWALKKHIPVHLIGIDINKDCILVAKNKLKYCPVVFNVSDYKEIHFDAKPDIIFSSLFCHHFKDDEVVAMLQWMKLNCRKGFFINDLHRHPLAYYFIKITTKLFSRSYLVKNDAPLSVLRGFRKKEWKSFFINSGIRHFSIGWHWAFRYLIVNKHE